MDKPTWPPYGDFLTEETVREKSKGMAVRFAERFTLVETHSSGFGINADGSAWVERDGNRQEIGPEDRDALGSFVFGGIYDLVRPKTPPVTE